MADIRPPANAAQAIAATALRAEQARMRIIAENIANANSTSRTPGGDPYRRQVPVFEPMRIDAGQGVEMVRVTPDRSDFKVEYDPGHPSADAEGYVKLPNVNTLIESLDMKAAQRAYEANLTVIETARAMQLRTLDLIRK
ncbi:MAG: flagellar basal body rod protein FlgC [Phenylobacterium sp.]|jgi:flagellar basal-body rod protein FlgC|uniref:flagellar basal body rod protein FlgC n=1 Tax=Phenylobacterium sp. TaxID=1871053 RepID=UPI0025E3CF5F|nr:flagellar basal body rod protein FlgC [Phenylobacterium sp.]MCA3502431.1 flagellar basal body rod protein FlgC [Rhodobacter sp.]MCA3712443.1 flagellar basal body rod protein FlgC [Phenylobacterium sp.]MCA3714979.1 flagellar basal body rod protein FlgC [Phenylobacterium sp.]MCA3723184.1 flagellar basal body rod protein FlgC [Phenylobacterium sp.]MCA3726629.1 flagellar basal body rod protein FlgC [Phenylobacterium sp.]